MPTTYDPNRRFTLDASPEGNPITALLRDHTLVRKLADSYLNSHSADVRKQAAAQLVQAVHNLERLKETVFYPAVRRVEPNLVAHLEEASLGVDDVLAALQGAPDPARADALLRELIAAVTTHMRDEETSLFPLLQHAAIDLAPIGAEMRAFEANLVHMQARRSDRATRR
jgi:hemerythrin superfamily protein